MADTIPPLCPSLTKWLNDTSLAERPIGQGGPNAHMISPAKACLTNRAVVCELIARAGFTPAPDKISVFAGPLGLSAADFLSLRTAMAYIEGHADANGIDGDELQRYFDTEIMPTLTTIREGWAKQYPEQFAEDEVDNEIHH